MSPTTLICSGHFRQLCRRRSPVWLLHRLLPLRRGIGEQAHCHPTDREYMTRGVDILPVVKFHRFYSDFSILYKCRCNFMRNSQNILTDTYTYPVSQYGRVYFKPFCHCCIFLRCLLWDSSQRCASSCLMSHPKTPTRARRSSATSPPSSQSHSGLYSLNHHNFYTLWQSQPEYIM